MKKIKYLSLIMIIAFMLTGCGSTTNNEKKDDNKPIAVNPPSETNYKGVKKIVYLDPTNLNKKCTESDVKSDDETRSGCMKWYAYKEDKDTYTMILDHNTTNLVYWLSLEDYEKAGGNVTYNQFGDPNLKTDKGPITAQKQLESDTSYWEKSLNARLIKVSEIKEIAGNIDNTCLDTNSSNKYNWLYDRTSNYCEKYGCLNNATKDALGYWTDTARDEYSAYRISPGFNQDILCGGQLSFENGRSGIRPVITIQKNALTFIEENENNN